MPRNYRLHFWMTCSWIFAALPFSPVVLAAETNEIHKVQSPNSQLQLEIYLRDGRPHFRVLQQGKTILTHSPLGLTFADESVSGEYVLETIASGEITSRWQPVWGKRSTVRNHYHYREIGLQDKLAVEFRVYDDAIALRYKTSADSSSSRILQRELTTLNFVSDPICWSYNGENPNVGPEQLSTIDKARKAPMACKLADHCYLGVYEAALYDATWMKLVSDVGENNLRIETSPYKIAKSGETPWRVLMFGTSPGELVDSEVLMNLNPPTQLKETSWIKPGVCFWDWRAWGHKTDDGFTYELSLPSWKRFVDFAEETDVPYLLLDANWYGPEFEANSNPTETGKVNAVRELLAYAKKRNVGILLYLNDVARQKYDLKAVLKNYSDWGAVGIKYGFMKGGGKDKVRRTRQIIELCAENRLFVDFHDGPIPPSGDRRTWPNCLTREFCHAQSDALKAFVPKTFVTAAFVNGLAGPIDMSNGMFDLNHSLDQRPRVLEEIPSTIVAEAARSLIVFTGLNVLPDSADSYRKHLELFGFIAAQKMPWTESKTLQGEIGEYIVTMRQTGETFLVGSATDEHGRTLSIPLDFLGEGEYEATLYEDAPDAHYLKNREAYSIRHLTVTAKSVIQAKLAPGGGHCIKLVPKSN